MSEKELSPSESLSLITDIIEKAKIRFKENGHIYIYWGVLTFVASFLQFVLLLLKQYEYNYYPYVIMPIGFIMHFILFRKKLFYRSPANIIGRILTYAGICVGINLFIIGFFFYHEFHSAFFPTLLILLSILVILYGSALKYLPLLAAGLIINILAYIGFLLPQLYHPLILSISALIGFVIPGILINLKYRRNRV